MTRRTLLLLTLLVLSPSHLAARTMAPIDLKRTIVIDTVIGRGNLLELTPAMLEMSKDKSKPIDLIIQSPGGELQTGYLFVNTMEAVRAKGVTVRCFVPNLAASMAFQLLMHCDQRYTLDNALLLWHGARIFTGNAPVTYEVAAAMAQDLQEINQVILYDLNRVLGRYMDSRNILRHFLLETFHTGKQLSERAPGFIISVPAIPGLLEALTAKDVLRPPSIQLNLKPGDTTYSMDPVQ